MTWSEQGDLLSRVWAGVVCHDGEGVGFGHWRAYTLPAESRLSPVAKAFPTAMWDADGAARTVWRWARGARNVAVRREEGSKAT